MKNKVLEVKDLSFSYPDKSILHRLSFDVDAGDFMCIVGTNGTGKSTLLKLILNQLSPLEGEIKLLGTNSEKYKDFASIAYVSQKATNINRDFPATVEEVVSLGLYSKKGLFKRNTKADKKLIDSALERVGMLDYKHRQIGYLSGGQQQRVFIAKALISDPRIIFLDEPTTGIDIRAVDSICCLLGDLNKNSGISNSYGNSRYFINYLSFQQDFSSFRRRKWRSNDK
ncbi:MAG: metal ABC transporter ATP-binding protein [Lachnospirales bacterium]